MRELTLFGLPSCDTCRRARRALEAEGHAVALRDLSAAPLTEAEAADLLAEFGPALVNRRSTTWRGLSEAERDADPAALLPAHPALMKRPLITDGRRRTLGWDAATRAGWL